MEIEVTENDIRTGLHNSCYYCPIARAITRSIQVNVSVMSDFLLIGRGLECKRIEHPDSVKQFIFDFDHGIEVKPFKFELDYDPSNQT